MKPQSSSSKRILILHATAGAGHRKAAEAIHNGVVARGFENAVIVDALHHTSSFFRHSYSAGYEFIVGKLPKLWAVVFELTDQPWMLPAFQAVRRVYNGLNASGLVKYVNEERFDTIVTTHFFSTEVVGDLKKKGKISSRLVTVVTDYDVHKIWLSEGVDQYLVACDYTKQRLCELGVSEKKIEVTGIPVDEKFTARRDRLETRQKLGLKDEFTVLLSTSSFGFGPIEELASLLSDIQLVIICGNNKELFGRLTARGNKKHKICGFVDNMEEMMAAADVMVTKPGGLSICEALANNLPLIFFSAIPGQETGNVRVLARHGIGLSEQPLPQIAAEIRSYAQSPQKLQAAREAARALARPDSVNEIIKRII